MFSRMNIKKTVLWLFIIMVISFLIAGSILVTYGIDKTIISHTGKIKHQNVDTTKSFSSAGIKDIDIYTVSSDINVIPSDVAEVKLHFHGTFTSSSKNPAPELIASVSGSRLNVEIKHKPRISIGVNFENEDLALDVYIPKTYSDNIRTNTVSANVNISSLKLNTLNFETVSGDLKLTGVTTSETRFSSTSGDMGARNFSGNLDSHSVSGDIDLEYAAFSNSIRLDSTSGEAKITLPADAQFKLFYKSVSGDFNSNFPVSATDNPGSHRAEASVGSSSNEINITSVSGDANIEK